MEQRASRRVGQPRRFVADRRAAPIATMLAGGVGTVCLLVAATGLPAVASTHQGLAPVGGKVAQVAATPPAVVWARLNGGTTSATQVGAQLGLARTSDGILHVIWNRGSSRADGQTTIFQTRLSPTGSVLGTSTVSSGWAGLAGGNALVVMPDKTLRLFVSGGYPPNGSGGINMLTAPPDGQTFTRDPAAVWGGEFAAASPYIAATLSHGQIVTAWSGSYHVGVALANSYPSVYSFMSVPQLATDAKTGAVVFSGITNAGKGGVYVQQVLPSRGPGRLLASGTNTDSGASEATARIGAGGVYVLTADGQAKVLALTRYNGGAVVVARGAYYYYAGVFAAPGGRLWVTWYPGTGTDIYVTRSNSAVSRFEAVQTLALPAGSQLDDYPVYGNGSLGPLDFFARLSTGALSGFLFTHVLAIMHVTSAVVPILSKVVVPVTSKVVVPVTSKKGKVVGHKLELKVVGHKLELRVVGHRLKVFVSESATPSPAPWSPSATGTPRPRPAAPPASTTPGHRPGKPP